MNVENSSSMGEHSSILFLFLCCIFIKRITFIKRMTCTALHGTTKCHRDHDPCLKLKQGLGWVLVFLFMSGLVISHSSSAAILSKCQSFVHHNALIYSPPPL